MSTYAVSDIHGCFDEFIQLLELIKFVPGDDTLYVLGDAADRGDKSLECLLYIKHTNGISPE